MTKVKTVVHKMQPRYQIFPSPHKGTLRLRLAHVVYGLLRKVFPAEVCYFGFHGLNK